MELLLMNTETLLVSIKLKSKFWLLRTCPHVVGSSDGIWRASPFLHSDRIVSIKS